MFGMAFGSLELTLNNLLMILGMSLGPIFMFALHYFMYDFTCAIMFFGFCCVVLPISLWKEGYPDSKLRPYDLDRHQYRS